MENTNGTEDFSKWSYTIVHPYFDDPHDYFYYPQMEDGTLGMIPSIKDKIDEKHQKKASNTIKMFKMDEGKLGEIGMYKAMEQLLKGSGTADVILKTVAEASSYCKSYLV